MYRSKRRLYRETNIFLPKFVVFPFLGQVLLGLPPQGNSQKTISGRFLSAGEYGAGTSPFNGKVQNSFEFRISDRHTLCKHIRISILRTESSRTRTGNYFSTDRSGNKKQITRSSTTIPQQSSPLRSMAPVLSPVRCLLARGLNSTGCHGVQSSQVNTAVSRTSTKVR